MSDRADLSDRAGGRAGEPRDGGVTLVELLVAMLVTSILMVVIGAVFANTLRVVSLSNTKVSTGADVRIAIEAMSRTIKVASIPVGKSASFASASSTGMAFYALLNRTGADSEDEPVATLIQYSYNPVTDCLTEAKTPGSAIANPAVGGPYYSWPSSATVTTCLLRTTSAPTFTYYTSGSLAATALAAASGLSATDLAAIRSVDLHLVAADPARSTVAGVPADTRITLENLIARDGS